MAQILISMDDVEKFRQLYNGVTTGRATYRRLQGRYFRNRQREIFRDIKRRFKLPLRTKLTVFWENPSNPLFRVLRDKRTKMPLDDGTGALPSATPTPALGTDGPAYHTGPVDFDVEAVVNAGMEAYYAAIDGGVNDAAASSAALKASLDMASATKKVKAKAKATVTKAVAKAVSTAKSSKGATKKVTLTKTVAKTATAKTLTVKKATAVGSSAPAKKVAAKTPAKKVAAKTPAKKAPAKAKSKA